MMLLDECFCSLNRIWVFPQVESPKTQTKLYCNPHPPCHAADVLTDIRAVVTVSGLTASMPNGGGLRHMGRDENCRHPGPV